MGCGRSRDQRCDLAPPLANSKLSDARLNLKGIDGPVIAHVVRVEHER